MSCKINKFFKKIVDRFNISIRGEDDEVVRQFKTYLNDINREMSIKISEKMMEHKELTRQFKDLLVEYSPEEEEVSSAKIKMKRKNFILNWDLRGDNTYMSLEDETGFTIFRMLKELVIDICKVYPNILLNKVDYTNRYVPKHWLKGSKKFSEKHKNDVIKFMLKDGEEFSKFYGNKNIEAVLKYVLKNNEDILSLLNSIPFYAGILDDEKKISSIFDGEILKKLGYYFLLCSFLIYISAFESNLKVDIVEEEEQDPEEDLSVLRGQQEILEKILVHYYQFI